MIHLGFHAPFGGLPCIFLCKRCAHSMPTKFHSLTNVLPVCCHISGNSSSPYHCCLLCGGFTLKGRHPSSISGRHTPWNLSVNIDLDLWKFRFEANRHMVNVWIVLVPMSLFPFVLSFFFWFLQLSPDLPSPLKFGGPWKVALVGITFPARFIAPAKPTEIVFTVNNQYFGLTELSPPPTTAQELVEPMQELFL